MSMSRVNILLSPLPALLLVLLACGTAWGDTIDDVTATTSNHQERFVPAHLTDGSPGTAWVGGGAGVGPGKWIELSFPAEVKLQSMQIANGNQGPGQFRKFRRATRAVILYPGGARQKIVLEPVSGMQSIQLLPETVDTLKIIITAVAPGARDKSIGNAKVSLSEITIFGEKVEPGPEEAPDTTHSPASVKKAEKKTASKPASRPEKKTKTPPRKSETERTVKAKPQALRKPKSAPPVKPKESKPEPAPKPAVMPKAKAAPTAKTKAKATPKKKQPQPKKTAETKPRKDVSSPSETTITLLRSAASIPVDQPLDAGVISPWLDLEFVALIKQYFAHLTTLHDGYPEVFAPSIRERERAVFIDLQNEMRAQKLFGKHHIAMVESIGLHFDKPTLNGNQATVRTHGPYRYYFENRAFEIDVDSTFSFTRENGKWRISDVRDK